MTQATNPQSHEQTGQSTAATARFLHVNQSHSRADDGGPATPDRPLQTIQAAALQAQPGDTVIIHAGIYRERVGLERGGEPDQPITFQAAPGEQVIIRGSDVLTPNWTPVSQLRGIISRELSDISFGSAAYAGTCDQALYGNFNPYHLNFNRAAVARPHTRAIEQQRARVDNAPNEKKKAEFQTDLDAMTRTTDRRYRTTLGQIFIDGQPMPEVESTEQLQRTPGSWMVDEQGDALLLHPPTHVESIDDHLVELTVRHTVFAPLRRGLGHIHLRNLTFEHAANHTPAWGKQGWPQVGAVSCRTGHHWLIERCTIRHAKGIGLDCGSEGASANTEFADIPWSDENLHDSSARNAAANVGYHLIQHNDISDNGHCGIAGIRHHGTQVLYNCIERNNCGGWSSPWWEFAGIKFHFFYDGLIEGNLIRDNEAHGIWLDNQWRGSRVTRNVIVNNLWSGINMELGRGPCLIDHNIIAHTRQGDGVYGHDVAEVTIAHNLIYANANFGVWFAYATPRVKPEDGCWKISTLNNMILGNRAGAIAYPLPWEAGGDNVSDGNLLMGGGQYLDEGSGPQPPLFQITNATHMATMQPHLSFDAMTHDRLRNMLTDRLREAGLDEAAWPNLNTWSDHCLLNLTQWQAALDCDQNSRVFSAIRDSFNARMLNWRMTLDDQFTQVKTQPVEGADKDYFGSPLPKSNPRPGPFQNLPHTEPLNLQLWPHPRNPRK